MAYELPPFQSTLKGLPQDIPNVGIQQHSVDTGPAQVALRQQAQQQDINQQDINNNLKTVQMATKLAQSMVEASKQRQQRDAIHAYAMTLPHATPQQADLLSAFPTQSMKAISRNMFPTTLQGIAANQVNNGQLPLESAASVLQKPQFEQATVMQNGKPTIVSYPKNNPGAQQVVGEAAKVAPIGGGSIKTIDRLMPDGTTHIIQLGAAGEKDLGLKGSASTNNPAAATKSSAEFAASLRSHIPEMQALISKADAAGLVGPKNGRLFNDFMAGRIGSTGNADVDQLAGQLREFNSLMNSGTLKAHFGARGGQQMYDKFVQNLDATKMSAAQMNGALDSLDKFMQGYERAGQNAGQRQGIEALRQSVRQKLGL